MAELIFAESFIKDMTQVVLESRRNEIARTISLLEYAPEIGSGIIPASIRETYGDSVRKLVITPFDVVYEYDKSCDEVHVLGLLHQRAAW